MRDDAAKMTHGGSRYGLRRRQFVLDHQTIYPLLEPFPNLSPSNPGCQRAVNTPHPIYRCVRMGFSRRTRVFYAADTVRIIHVMPTISIAASDARVLRAIYIYCSEVLWYPTRVSWMVSGQS